MRILCFLHSFEPGGVERTALRLCDRWQDDGAEVVVLLGRTEGRMRAEAPPLDYRLPPQPPIPIGWCETLWMIIWLPWAIRRVRPDILFCAGNSYTVVAVAMKLLLGRRCPPIVAKVSNDLARRDLPAPFRAFYHIWCRIQGWAIDRIVALSPAMRDEIAVIMAVPHHRIALIANPVLDAPRVAALERAGRTSRASCGITPGRRFVAAGRLTRQKNFPMMLAAFASGAAPADRLVILGDGAERARLERMIAAVGLSGRVRLAGHSDQVEAWFAESDILLLSSRYEGLPAVVVEAMAAGLAVVATDCCASMADLIGANAACRLVPVDDVAQFAKAIAAIGHAADPGSLAARVVHHHVEPVATAYAGLFAALSGAAIPIQARPSLPGPSLSNPQREPA